MKLRFSSWSSVFINHFLQFIFIFSSVFFAFWLTNRGETNKLKKIEKTAIQGVHKELTDNLAELEKAYLYHDTIYNKIMDVTDSMLNDQVSIEGHNLLTILQERIKRNASTLGLPRINSSAWHTFRQNEAFILLDYNLSSQLAEYYKIQEVAVERTSLRLADFFMSEKMFITYDVKANMQVLGWMIRELRGQEQYLIYFTKKTLSDIEEVYPQITQE